MNTATTETIAGTLTGVHRLIDGDQFDKYSFHLDGRYESSNAVFVGWLGSTLPCPMFGKEGKAPLDPEQYRGHSLEARVRVKQMYSEKHRRSYLHPTAIQVLSVVGVDDNSPVVENPFLD